MKHTLSDCKDQKNSVIPAKIYNRPVSFYPGCYKDRWFVEVQTPNKVWHDVGNCKYKHEAQRLLNRIRLVNNSWFTE